MTSATDSVVEASVCALEFSEAAWDADEQGREFPDASTLSDPALLAILRYARSDLPARANLAVRQEATHRGLRADFVDRLLPWVVVISLLSSGAAIVGALLS